jgi:hypothetical protein
MSFYNVLNPAVFEIYKPDQFGLVDQGKIVRTSGIQYINGGSAQTSSFSVTAQQIVAGRFFVNAGATGSGYAPTGSAGITMTLPSATDFVQLLLGPGGFDVSNNDIFMLRVQNTSAAFKLYIAPGADGVIGASSYAKLNLVPPFPVVTYSSEAFIPIQIGITVNGAYTYTLI